MATGLRIAQRGTDVKNAADYQFVLNSDWPILKVLVAKPFSVSGLTDNQEVVVYEHNLDYIPPFIIYDSGSSFGIPTLNFNESGQSFANFQSANNLFTMDDKRLYYNSGFSFAYSFTGFFIIFDYDLSKTFQAPSVSATSASVAKDSSIGMKVAKPFKAIRDKNDRDMNIDTTSRAMTIHMTDKVDVSTTVAELTIEHRLGYNPIALAYEYVSSSLTGAGRARPLIARTEASPFAITFRGAQSILSGTFSYIVLKDPLLVQ